MEKEKCGEKRLRHQKEMKEVTEQLESQLLRLYDSEQYAAFLKALGSFWHYSLNNQLLIMAQFPGASFVASCRTWKTKFRRHVKKGERGIRILVPMQVRRKKSAERDPYEEDGPEPGKDDDRITVFKIGNVFDISQTEGEPLPSLGVRELEGSFAGYDHMIRSICGISPVPVKFSTFPGDAKGYYDLEKREIVVKDSLSQQHTIHTLLHELTHAMLDQNELGRKMDRASNEVTAESVSYAVCSHLGMDTSPYSCGYIVSWSDGRSLSEFRTSIKAIRDTAAEIIGKLDLEE